MVWVDRGKGGPGMGAFRGRAYTERWMARMTRFIEAWRLSICGWFRRNTRGAEVRSGRMGREIRRHIVRRQHTDLRVYEPAPACPIGVVRQEESMQRGITSCTQSRYRSRSSERDIKMRRGVCDVVMVRHFPPSLFDYAQESREGVPHEVLVPLIDAW